MERTLKNEESNTLDSKKKLKRNKYNGTGKYARFLCIK